ncbi:daptide-type RiPP [Streptomyces sp. NPDC093707]
MGNIAAEPGLDLKFEELEVMEAPGDNWDDFLNGAIAGAGIVAIGVAIT